VLTIVSLLIDAGVIPPGTAPFPYFSAIQNGFASAIVTCLLINGFVGFQLYEDGTPLSLWMMWIFSTVAFAISFLVSLATFKSWAGLGPTRTVGLFVVLYLVNAVQLAVYIVMQLILVTRTLQDKWPIGNIAIGILFFAIGQVIMYVFSNKICEAVSHYVDGLFFATLCNLLGVMMVYKYWDSITKEDLEFSVGTKMNNWEVKDLLTEEERRATAYADEPGRHSSMLDSYAAPTTRAAHWLDRAIIIIITTRRRRRETRTRDDDDDIAID
jgi:predicted small integral membrane protein